MSAIWVGSNDAKEPEFHLKVFEVQGIGVNGFAAELNTEGKYLLTGIISKAKQINLHLIKLLLLELNLHLQE